MQRERSQYGTGGFRADGWRTARACGPNGGNCVEVNLTSPNAVGVRDTKRWTGDVRLAVSPGSWQAFLGAARSGRFDGA
ncbi:DUF397 domain-containing protein [Saccharopolyspora sp. HNM0983]|uniref:DUF397 domain-containing protein n=1 Tax=Saccharopolyspora montiporae TaxID=2781240 RepID=A0A929BAS1_9PSEU|nr:DUF397 domain-containing protein [Saccharopolyspora sp. HNM0983]MBE9375391.1 DUF397 domain-containing protein [Saccharopolyspora sp. HNM0983]